MYRCDHKLAIVLGSGILPKFQLLANSPSLSASYVGVSDGRNQHAKVVELPDVSPSVPPIGEFDFPLGHQSCMFS